MYTNHHVRSGVFHLSLPAVLCPLGFIFSAADRKAYLADLPSPLNWDDPPLHLITFSMCVSKAAILCIDLHPIHK